MTQDRVGASEFPLTHKLLAIMLGVRRANVTEATLALQSAGLIGYRRGRITVLDRAGLEAASCEWNGVIRGCAMPPL
jgi:Mn-dependent DtxR family transcriptional regulator